jgi:hypothetical protein
VLFRSFNEIFDTNKNILETQGPKPVNKILINTQNDYHFNIPDYDTQLTELRNFYKV